MCAERTKKGRRSAAEIEIDVNSEMERRASRASRFALLELVLYECVRQLMPRRRFTAGAEGNEERFIFGLLALVLLFLFYTYTDICAFVRIHIYI